jgi:hypothetical protein
MRETYGELILPKGFILYHTSDEIFSIESDKVFPILFCVFHPSEWELTNITKITLKKDISLFFAIDFKIIDEKNNLLLSKTTCVMKKITKTDFFIRNVKIVKDYLSFFSSKLKENNFNGWIGLQKINNGNIEIGLINNPDIYDFETEQIKKDWKREGMNYNKTIVIQKRWGDNYPIYFNKNVIINLNERYKYFIELFLQNIENKKYKFNKCLHILLRDSQINFHKGNLNDIIWDLSHLETKEIRLIDRCIFLI